MQGIVGKDSITIDALIDVFDLSDAKTEHRTCHFRLILAMNILGETLSALLSRLFQDALGINAVFASMMVHILPRSNSMYSIFHPYE